MADHVELVDGLTCLWLKLVSEGKTSYINTDKIDSVDEDAGSDLVIIHLAGDKNEYFNIHLPISEVMQVLLPGGDDEVERLTPWKPVTSEFYKADE